MPRVKVCGMNDPALVRRAAELGASYVGLVFYPPSPRYLDPARAREVAAEAGTAETVGLFVDASEREIEAVLRYVPLDVLQLHGDETPERVQALAAWSGLRVMKALRVEEAADLAPLDEHADAADMVLFDAKPPRHRPDALPGGNGLAFDWQVLESVAVAKPWALAGGLNPDNLARAVGLVRPPIVDVSSGIESRPGVKDVDKLEAFLREARRLSASERT